MAINGKKKGGKYERVVSKLFEDWTGYEFARVPQSGGLRWKATDNITGDILCSDPDHKNDYCLSVECKTRESIDFNHLLLPVKNCAILDFWEQSKSDAIRGKKIPIVVMRMNGMPKSTQFIILETRVFNSIRIHLPMKHGYIKFNGKGERLIIFRSEDLFNSDYKKVNQILIEKNNLRHGK